MHDTIRDFDLNDPETYRKVFHDHMYKKIRIDTGSQIKSLYHHEEYPRVGYILLYLINEFGPRFVANKRWDVPTNYIGSWETAFIFRRSGEYPIDETSAAKKLHYVFGTDIKYAKNHLHLLKEYKIDSKRRGRILKLYSMDVSPFFAKNNMDEFEPDATFSLVKERTFRDRSKNPLDSLAISLFNDHYLSGKLHTTIETAKEKKNLPSASSLFL